MKVTLGRSGGNVTRTLIIAEDATRSKEATAQDWTYEKNIKIRLTSGARKERNLKSLYQASDLWVLAELFYIVSYSKLIRRKRTQMKRIPTHEIADRHSANLTQKKRVSALQSRKKRREKKPKKTFPSYTNSLFTPWEINAVLISFFLFRARRYPAPRQRMK